MLESHLPHSHSHSHSHSHFGPRPLPQPSPSPAGRTGRSACHPISPPSPLSLSLIPLPLPQPSPSPAGRTGRTAYHPPGTNKSAPAPRSAASPARCCASACVPGTPVCSPCRGRYARWCAAGGRAPTALFLPRGWAGRRGRGSTAPGGEAGLGYIRVHWSTLGEIWGRLGWVRVSKGDSKGGSG